MFNNRIHRDCLLLILLSGILYLSFLGGSRLWDWDEAINASTAREMFQQNDWVVPRFNGDLNYNKPIMVTLSIILAYSVFGISEFAARLPSALWSIGTVLCVYQIGLSLFNRPIAFRMAFVLATMLLFCVEARAATPDAVLIFWCTAAMMFYVVGTFQTRTPEELEADTPPKLRNEGDYFPRSFRFLLPMFAAMGVAVLAKGPVGFVLPMAVIVFFLFVQWLRERKIPISTGVPVKLVWGILIVLAVAAPWYIWVGLKQWLRERKIPISAGVPVKWVWGILIVLAVAAPWYIWVGLKTDWSWPSVFLMKHNVGRALAPMEGHHGPFYYYLGAILFDTFPWSIFFIPVCIDLIKRLRRGTPFSVGLVFALCWSVVIMGAFSCAATKLPNYIATMFPAAAMVYAVFLYHWSKNEELSAKIWTPFALSVYVVVGIVLAVVMVIISFPMGDKPAIVPGDAILSLVGILMILGGAAAFVVWKTSSQQNLELVLRCVFIVFLMSLFFWGAGRVSKHQRYVEMFAAVRTENPNAEFALLNSLEPSWIFYSGGPMTMLKSNDIENFLEQNNNGYVLSRENDYEEFKAKTEFPTRVVASAPYLLRQKNLVVITSAEK